jgi:hypothetical protein
MNSFTVAISDTQRAAAQRRADRWRRQYNTDRPHEALGGRTPVSVYRPSRRVHPGPLPPLRYPRSWAVRHVRNRGHIKWQGRLRFIGRAFVGQTIGLKSLQSEHWAVYLGQQLIGHLHAKDVAGLRPARWERRRALNL